MKYKTTRKAVVNGSTNIVSVGYCDLATLLRNHSPNAYTCGVYGWNFDVYEVYGLTICTGYRGMPGRTANNVREYESRAEIGKKKTRELRNCCASFAPRLDPPAAGGNNMDIIDILALAQLQELIYRAISHTDENKEPE